ncbi:MAG: DUF2291 domain-containing protein [Spirochaetia bacterium]
MVHKALSYIIHTFILMICLLIAGSCTVVRHDQQTESEEDELSIYFDNGEFDAKLYVESVWEEAVLPRIKEEAVEAEVLFESLNSDPSTAIEKYGYRIEVTAPYNFMVKGSAIITQANVKSAAATISIDANGPDGKPVEIQIGPVIKGTAVRDSMDFIHFEDFTNQLEFANISREMNNHIKATILASLKREELVGAKIRYLGAFQWVEGEGVLITPVDLVVEE